MNPIFFLRILCALLFITAGNQAFGQYKVRFVVARLPSYHKPSERIFIAGSFNNWNPGNTKFSIAASESKNGIIIDMPRGKVEYKLTRGSWESVEAAAGGAGTGNRILEVMSDTTVEIEVSEWADYFPKKAIQSTASANVHIVDTAFFIAQLARHRRVWIYLPPSYQSSRKKYPVLYMHDGQNVFDAATSFSGEWGVDETLDTLAPKHELIVVAIDNGGTKRMNEYSAYDMRFGKAEGDAYLAFIVETLMPYINKHYRAERSSKHTYIAGSSMGGLISFYALLKYPKKFGGAGVFSPAFWINPQFQSIDPKQLKKIKSRIYFFAGQQEGDEMVPPMLGVFNQMQKHSKAKMEAVIRAEGRHNESTWREEFPRFLDWLLHPSR